jgi:hypothetical protein
LGQEDDIMQGNTELEKDMEAKIQNNELHWK